MTSEASKHLDSERSTARPADQTAPLIDTTSLALRRPHFPVVVSRVARGTLTPGLPQIPA